MVPHSGGTVGVSYGAFAAQLVKASGVAELLGELLLIVVGTSRTVLVN
jgi:hypothetical protein